MKIEITVTINNAKYGTMVFSNPVEARKHLDKFFDELQKDYSKELDNMSKLKKDISIFG